MKVASIDTFIVSVPYKRREVSAVVARDGVTDVLVKITTDDGLVGWGEACSGADVVSVDAALQAMKPFVLGRDPWNGDAMQAECFEHGLWAFRPMTGNFAWAGIDMALLDICGKAAGQPLYRFFGGLRRSQVSYFYYLARSNDDDLMQQCQEGLAAGYKVFYLKVAVDWAQDHHMVATVRRALGAQPRLRLDANGAWSVPDALHHMGVLAQYDIDFIEAPVRDHPLRQMQEVRARLPMPVCCNEGLWTEADAYARILGRVADVYCFSPYWVGSLGAFHRLAHVAHMEGLQVVKHTHGELGLAAAACHHVLLTLPNIVTGHQQTGQHLEYDIVREPLPINTGPLWGVPEGTGLCVEIDDDALERAADNFRREGQYLPYQQEMLRKEEKP